MTGINENNNKFVPAAPKTYEVRFVEKQEQVKKSPLSAAARSKVINRSGSNYVSENQESYGPCVYCGKTSTLNVKIQISGDNGGARTPSSDPVGGIGKGSPTNLYLGRSVLEFSDSYDAREVVSLINQGNLYIVNSWGIRVYDNLCQEAKEIISKAIKDHDNGKDANINKTLSVTFRNDDRVIRNGDDVNQGTNMYGND